MSNIQTGAERMPHDLSHLGFLAGQIGRLITISTTPVIAGDSFETDGDVVRVEFPVEIRKVIADQRATQNRRRAAIERGPIVYCAEWPDVEGGRVLDLLIDPKVPLKSSVDATLDGGVALVHAQATS